MKASLWQGDCILRMKELPSDSVDAVVTDPPYGIKFMGKDWDDPVEGYEAFSRAWLAEAYRVLVPGGQIKVFAATRTMHRLASAMVHTGFLVGAPRAWTFASGFPKAPNVGVSLTKAGFPDYEAMFDGFRGTLKPAWEPILVGQKPLVG